MITCLALSYLVLSCRDRYHDLSDKYNDTKVASEDRLKIEQSLAEEKVSSLIKQLESHKDDTEEGLVVILGLGFHV